MAKFVGKTFESLNSMLNNSGLFLNYQDRSISKLLSCSVDLKSFERKLRSVESKQEEDNVVNFYISAIQKRLSEPDVPNAEVNEMIKMCMACESLGYPTPFISVHCLKLAQKGNLREKHTGYMASAVFLHPNHELVILLINTIQKDLCSSNYQEVLIALSSICNLINFDTVHNVLHLVEDKLTHEKSAVRKSAILTMGHCLNVINSQSAYQIAFPKLERALTDSELEVVSAAVCVIRNVVKKLPSDFSYLIKSLIVLQDQILLRRVPGSMIYCDIPAPWLQLEILQLFNLLCKDSEHYQETVPILKKTLQQFGLQNNLIHGILYQVIETITCAQPCTELVEMILSSISVLLKSKSINMKLTGLEALVLVIQRIKPSITTAQQDIIMECLKQPDEIVQLKTLNLLYHLANPSNVQAICKKLMEFLVSISSPDRKKELALKIIELAKMFIDRQEWFVSTVLSTLVEVENSFPYSEVYAIIEIITKDDSLKNIAKAFCIEKCKTEDVLPSSFLKLTSLVLSTTNDYEEIFPIVVKIADEEAMNWFLVALSHQLIRSKEISADFVGFLENLELKHHSSSLILKELIQITRCISSMDERALSEEIDPSLTFLDSFVVQALEKSSNCYLPESFRTSQTQVENSFSSFVVDSFSEISLNQDLTNSPSQKSLTYTEFSSPSTSFQSLSNDLPVTSKLKSRSVWTEEGRKDISTEDNTQQQVKSESSEKMDEELRTLFAGTKIS